LLPGLHSTHTEPPFGVIAVLTQYRCGALLNVSDNKHAASACQCIIVGIAILPDAHSSAFVSTAIASVVGWVWRLAFGEPFTSRRDETYRRTGSHVVGCTNQNEDAAFVCVVLTPDAPKGGPRERGFWFRSEKRCVVFTNEVAVRQLGQVVEDGIGPGRLRASQRLRNR